MSKKKTLYGKIVAERTIRFTSDTWAWIKVQKNYSQAVRDLIKTQLGGVKRGRPKA